MWIRRLITGLEVPVPRFAIVDGGGGGGGFAMVDGEGSWTSMRIRDRGLRDRNQRRRGGCGGGGVKKKKVPDPTSEACSGSN